MSHILIIDGEGDIYEQFRAILEERGHSVSFAADLPEAEDRLSQIRCQVIIADIAMPQMLERVQEIDADIPLLIVTNDPDAPPAREALCRGAYDYIAQPITEEALLHVVDRAAEKKYLLDEKSRLEAENRAYQEGMQEKVVQDTDELKRRNRELAELIEMAHNASSAPNLEEVMGLSSVLEAILENALKLVSGDDAHVFFYDGERLTFAAARWADESQLEPYAEPRQDGLTYTVARTGERMVVSDVKTHPLFQKSPWPEWDGAIVGLPLRIDERVYGVMNVAFEEPHRFSKNELNGLEMLADQATIAIETARFFDKEQYRVAQLNALSRIGRQMTSILDQQELLQQAVDAVREDLGYLQAAVLMMNEETDELYVAAATDNFWEVIPDEYRQPVGKGAIGWAAQTGETLLINNATNHPRVYRVGDWLSPASLSVPIKIGDHVIGVLEVEANEINAFDESDRLGMEILADQIAITIENARLYDEARRRVEELTILHNIDTTITSTLRLDDLLQQIYEQINQVIGCDAFYITLCEAEQGVLRIPFIVDDDEQLSPLTLRIDGKETLSSWVIRNRETLWIDDSEEEPLPAEKFILDRPPRSLMMLPLLIRDEVIGAISVQSYRPHAFEESHRRLLSGIAAQVAIVVENAQLFEETKRRLTEMSLLQQVALSAASTLDFDLVLEETVKALQKALEIERLSFLLPDEEEEELVFHPPLINLGPVPQGIPIESSLVGRAYQSGQPVLKNAVNSFSHIIEEDSEDTESRSVLAVPVRTGQSIGAVLYAESPRTRMFNEDDLRIFTTLTGQLGVMLENARLYRTLEEQKNELSQAYEELKELDQLRSEVIQNVSHELNTPLSLVQGYVELLLSEHLGKLQESQREALKVIWDRAKQLERLIHNLTTLQNTPHQPNLVPVALDQIIRQALLEFKHSARLVGVRFRKEIAENLPSVLGEPNPLELAFHHLIDNAVKFSPDGGTVTLRAWADASWVYVSISDEGIGISPAHADRIFERFYQVDGSSSRRFGGMGVGLALVWEIIEAHEGKVTVDSEPDEGSTFTVALPRIGDH